MPGQSQDEVRKLLDDWRQEIGPSEAHIREKQNDLLLKLDPQHIPFAVTFMSIVLRRGDIQVTTNNTNIGTAGVAVTGGTSSGDITGNVQQNLSSDTSKILEQFEELRHRLSGSTELDNTQKADSELAIQDLESEAKKSPQERNPSRIRIAMSMLGSTVKLVDGAQHLYDTVAPHLANLLHHL